MTRDEALSLSAELEGAGISHSIECGIHPKMSLSPNYNVAPSTFRLEAEQLRALMEMADERGLHLMLHAAHLLFVTDAKANRLT